MSYQLSDKNMFYIHHISQVFDTTGQKFIYEQKGFDNRTQSFKIIFQIAEALQVLKQLNLCHGNLKPSNIGIDSKRQAKIMDFSVEVNFDPEYSAPELIQTKQRTHECDIYSLGLIGFYLFSGKQPFLGLENKYEIPNQPEFVEYFPKCDQYKGLKFDDQIMNFFTKCCKKNPKERITIEELIKWLDQPAFPEKYYVEIMKQQEQKMEEEYKAE